MTRDYRARAAAAVVHQRPPRTLQVCQYVLQIRTRARAATGTGTQTNYVALELLAICKTVAHRRETGTAASVAIQLL